MYEHATFAKPVVYRLCGMWSILLWVMQGACIIYVASNFFTSNSLIVLQCT